MGLNWKNSFYKSRLGALKEHFWKDIGIITLICILVFYMRLAIFQQAFLKGFIVAVYDAVTPFYTIPVCIVMYLAFAVPIRLMKSRLLFFAVTWLVVWRNIMGHIEVAESGTTITRVAGRELYKDGRITEFGYLFLSFEPATIFALSATLYLLLGDRLINFPKTLFQMLRKTHS